MHKTHRKRLNVNLNAEQVAKSASGKPTTPAYAQIKQALDVHAASMVVIRMISHACRLQSPASSLIQDFAFVDATATPDLTRGG